MAHFQVYNTSDPTRNDTPLAGNASLATPLVIDTQQEGSLVGTVISDQPGTLFVDQSLDHNALTGSGHWDYTSSYPVTAGLGVKINEEVIGTVCQIRFTSTSATAQTYLRIFVRTFGTKTG